MFCRDEHRGSISHSAHIPTNSSASNCLAQTGKGRLIEPRARLRFYECADCNSRRGFLSTLQVSEVNVPTLLGKLKSREWMAPLFQREFVWSNADVVALVNSIIDAKPVGMVTLWEQTEDAPIMLEPICIEDRDENGALILRAYGDEQNHPGRYYAILDGRQRSTAIALAFGGLRAKSKRFRSSGRYYLDVTAKDDEERVLFISETDVSRKQISSLAAAVSKGLFPLEVEEIDKFFQQWMNYIQIIRDPAYYSDGQLPESQELDRRTKIIKDAFDGIINTKIAVYTVPKNYDLATICEVFQTLNTRGTKVSAVDLIHSNVYNDTHNDRGGPLLLREKIDELGQIDGAIGWASSKERPELLAQMVAAVHVALDNKPQPRRLTSSKEARITSVKSSDLLAIPAPFWRKLLDQPTTLATALAGFQNAVAGGMFGHNDCPYPASAAIYVALRWYYEEDRNPGVHWTPNQLARLYGAFFWRNALSTRYDQGFLTQIGQDIANFKEFLNSTKEGEDDSSWRIRASTWLDDFLPMVPPQVAVDIVSDGKETGALRKAARLLLIARASIDIYTDSHIIKYGSDNLQIHHIYPRDWCANNAVPSAQALISADNDWVNSAANLMPMHRDTNLLWRKKSPAQFLHENNLDFESRQELWVRYFIDYKAYQLLAAGPEKLEEFWTYRGKLISDEINRRMQI